jgi:hypothetical protein
VDRGERSDLPLEGTTRENRDDRENWFDSATEEEIAEAVGVAAVTRHWSTYLNGLQVDFETFKSELGGEVAAVK